MMTEMRTAPGSVIVTRFAKPTKDSPERTEPVLRRDQTLNLVGLARGVASPYCVAKRDHYPGQCAFVTADNSKA
jgi:hypothetical protein